MLGPAALAHRAAVLVERTQVRARDPERRVGFELSLEGGQQPRVQAQVGVDLRDDVPVALDLLDPPCERPHRRTAREPVAPDRARRALQHDRARVVRGEAARERRRRVRRAVVDEHDDVRAPLLRGERREQLRQVALLVEERDDDRDPQAAHVGAPAEVDTRAARVGSAPDGFAPGAEESAGPKVSAYAFARDTGGRQPSTRVAFAPSNSKLPKFGRVEYGSTIPGAWIRPALKRSASA